jgi:hypothetical protein
VTPVILNTVLIAPGIAAELSTNAEPTLFDETRPALFGVSVAMMQDDGSAVRVTGGRGVTAPIRSGVFASRAAAAAHIEGMRAYLRLAFEREGARADVAT